MNKGSHHRTVNGFTVIELLVCIFAVAILVSLLLPAVQHSRESSRSVACKNNLRQIGIAIHSMEATEKHFPAIGKQYVPNRYGFSCLVQLLPYLERNDLHQLFDFDESTSSMGNFSVVDSTPTPLWKCPSSSFLQHALTNYLGNGGTGVEGDLTDLEDGFLAPPPGATAADFADGLSNTVAFSECRTPQEPGDGLLRVSEGIKSRVDWQRACQKCSELHGPFTHESSPLGVPWSSPSLGTSRYRHVLVPGKPSCLFDGTYSLAVPTASSFHPSGVYALRVDGSVSNVSFQVSEQVWRDLGSRSDVRR